MPRSNLILGLLVLCIVTPWIVAESDKDENKTAESTTGALLVDDTRREDLRLFAMDLNTQPTILKEIGDKNETQSLFTGSFDQPTEELTGFETEVPCDNAQFLLKILTVMLPLLRDEVPANTRTSYVLHVLKALLKSSPEASQDYEVMYKINDLLVTLEKYHGNDKYDLNGSYDALRQRVTRESVPSDVRSKVVFKYEVPHLTNPDCTAELLSIIKTVQQAILRLVNNPLCKSQVPVEMPILEDVNEYFANPKLFKDLSLLPDVDKPKLLPKQYQILDVNIPEKNIVNKKPFYSYIPENTGTLMVNPNSYDKSPIQQEQKQHWYPEVPKKEPYYIYPEYQDGKKLIETPYSHNVSPGILSIINNGKDKPEYSSLDLEQPNPPPYINDQPYSPTPSLLNIKTPHSPLDVTNNDVQNKPYNNAYDYFPKEDDAPLTPSKQPKKRLPIYESDKYYPNSHLDTLSPSQRMKPDEEIHDYDIENPSSRPSSFEVYEDGSGKVQINKPPHHQYPPQHSYEFDLNSPSSSSPSLDSYGDDDFAETQNGPYRPNRPIKMPKPSPFNVDGSPNSAYVSVDQNPYKPDLYIHPKQNFNKNPNKYDTSTQNLPTERGVPDRPKPPFNPYLPNDLSNGGPNKLVTYNTYSPNPYYKPHTKQFIPFDVSGDGSGEIQLGPTELPIKDNIEFYLPKEPKTKTKHPYEFYRPRFPIHEKENPKNAPEHYWPEDGGNEDLNNLKPKIPNTIDVYTPDQETILLSEPITKLSSRPDAENQYVVIPDINKPYEDVPVSDDLSPEFDIPKNNEPKYWKHNNIPTNISPKPHLVPDNKILLIIKDNIDTMEQKIPKEHLDTEIREMIRRIKNLLDLKQITIEEYVNIINQYQLLIKYVKHLDISNAILKELLVSMTNLDKLDLLTGKLQFIELTYLIKRPKPLIYQPYYYIKYQLPYESLTKIERLLAVQPHLKKNPADLYKALISMSNVAETSPDLENYGKEDILELTFNTGTLVGAKMVKETDEDMYSILDKLKNINSDFTVKDVYELIKNLDAQFKHTSEGLLLDNSNIPILNTNEQSHDIRSMEMKKQPILQKVTKNKKKQEEKVTNKIAANNILSDILNKVNVLRSNMSANMSANYTEEGSNLRLESDTDKTNRNAPLVGRTRDTIYYLDQFNNGIPSVGYEAINYNTKSIDKIHSTNDLNDTKNNAEKSYYGLKTNNSDFGFDWNKLYSNPKKNGGKPRLPNQAEGFNKKS